MENKKSFILYADILEVVKKLPDEKAGILFKTILEYVNDKDPKIDDLLIDLVFTPIKLQLKRDLKKWEGNKEEKSKAGQISSATKLFNKKVIELEKENIPLEDHQFERGRCVKYMAENYGTYMFYYYKMFVEWHEQKITELTPVKSVKNKSTESTVNANVNVSVNDSVNVNDNVSVTENVTSKEKKKRVVAKNLQPQETILFNKLKDIFLDSYELVSGQAYYFQAKDGKAIKTIINQIKHAYKEKGIENPTDVELVNGFRHILNRAKNDKFVNQNFTLTIISSQFNSLKIAKNGTAEKNKQLLDEVLSKIAASSQD